MNDDAIIALITEDVESFFASPLAGAKLDEMEDKARDIARSIQCRLLQEALNRRVASANDGYRGTVVTTPDGRRAQFERYEPRELTGYGGRVTLRRAYYWVVGADERGGYSPLDDELGLNDQEETPSLQRGLNALGVEAPFAKAERLLGELTRTTVAPRTIAEVTENCGGRIRAASEERVAEAWKVFEGPTCGKIRQKGSWRRGERRRAADSFAPWAWARTPEVLYVQCDGGRVNTKAGWKEPKVAVLFADVDRVAISKERGELIRKEYVGTMGEIEPFQHQVWEAGLRWGAHKAKKIVVLGDGAEGFQKRLEELYPEALQILDWYHAAEHLWEVGRALYGVGTDLTKAWVKPLLDELRAGGVESVIDKLKKLRPSKKEQREKIAELIGYYTSNRVRMRYNEYEAAGYFIGSGAVESGVKNVVNIRMKGCGMRWEHDRADRLLTSRARYLSSEVPLRPLAVAA
jgi:hypothetical protein